MHERAHAEPLRALIRNFPGPSVPRASPAEDLVGLVAVSPLVARGVRAEVRRVRPRRARPPWTSARDRRRAPSLSLHATSRTHDDKKAADAISETGGRRLGKGAMTCSAAVGGREEATVASPGHALSPPRAERGSGITANPIDASPHDESGGRTGAPRSRSRARSTDRLRVGTGPSGTPGCPTPRGRSPACGCRACPRR